MYNPNWLKEDQQDRNEQLKNRMANAHLKLKRTKKN